MGNDPRQFSIFRHRRRSCAAACHLTREDVAIIDICKVIFGRACHGLKVRAGPGRVDLKIVMGRAGPGRKK